MLLLELPEDVLFEIFSRISFERLSKIIPVCRYLRNFIEKHPLLASKFPHHDGINYVDPSLHLLLDYGHEGVCYPYTSLVSNFAKRSKVKGFRLHNPLDKRGSTRSEIRTLGSCNGLLLQSAVGGKKLLIWNPSTKGHKLVSPVEFPPPIDPHQQPLKCWKRVYGLGCSANDDQDYKVILIKYVGESCSSTDLESEVGIYSLRSGSWKRIEGLCCPYLLYPRDQSIGICYPNSWEVARIDRICDDIFFHGTLHWIGFEWLGFMYSTIIVAFDFETERFKEMPLSEKYQEEIQQDYTNYKSLSFGVWKGCLSLLRNLGNECYDIIVMKEYGVKESWCKLYAISETVARNVCNIKLVCFTSNDKIVLLFDYQYLSLYDPISCTANKLQVCGDIPHHYCHTTKKLYVEPYRKNLLMPLIC
ncbi:hypothetical protein Sjap_011940 [Stephania japonica]|uniref:F-box domain-containing protein n=1 Tax=Stephania japonica TaxID=461633 RepID=A0AAP0P5G0_9MAGN